MINTSTYEIICMNIEMFCVNVDHHRITITSSSRNKVRMMCVWCDEVCATIEFDASKLTSLPILHGYKLCWTPRNVCL